MGEDKKYLRGEKWHKTHPEEAKAIKMKYRENNLGKRKIGGTKGPPLKKKKIEPFKKRISSELLAKIEENTRINNKYIKFFNTVETGRDRFLVRNILKKSRAIADDH